MTGFNDSDPKAPNLELDQEYLGELFRQLAGSIVNRTARFYEVADNRSVFPASEDAAEPKHFTFPVSPKVARELFYPGQNMVVTEAQVSYDDPHTLEEGDVEVLSNILVSITDRIPGTNYYHQADLFIKLSSIDGFSAVTDSQYSEIIGDDSRRVSPNDLPAGFVREDNIEDMATLLDDVFTYERPMTLEDSEKLKLLAAYLDEAHTL